eukprot:sb/3463980/
MRLQLHPPSLQLCNSVVLYGTLYRHALKADLITLHLLILLTLLDLLITLCNVLPLTLTTFSGMWMLGDTVCVFQALITRYLYLTQLLVVTLIAVHRLRVVLVRRPVRSALRIVKQQLITARFLLLGALLIPLLPLIGAALTSKDITFEPSQLSCVLPLMDHSWHIVSFLYLIVCSAAVIFSNLWILIIVLKFKFSQGGGFFSSIVGATVPGYQTRGKHKRNISSATYVPILLICSVFIGTYLPVYFMAGEDHTNAHRSDSPWLGVLMVELLSINVICNPVVYTLSNGRFRRYVISLIKCREFKVGVGRNPDESSDEGIMSQFFSYTRTSVASMRASVVTMRTSIARTTSLSRPSPGSSIRSSSHLGMYESNIAPGAFAGDWSCSPGRKQRQKKRMEFLRSRSCNTVLNQPIRENSSSDQGGMFKPKSCLMLQKQDSGSTINTPTPPSGGILKSSWGDIATPQRNGVTFATLDPLAVRVPKKTDQRRVGLVLPFSPLNLKKAKSVPAV